jgi:16S rRNA (guanine1207-N2)-methyltransferase
VRRDHLLTSTADGSTDLVLCNPPFHRGAARDSDAAFAMFTDAARVLRPGGELWTVYNSHLPYLPALRRLVGSTRIVSQDPRYVVTRSIAHP